VDARAPHHDNAFALLGLPERYDLEPAVIEAAFFEKTRELHPDRFASAPAAERVAALSRSRALNDAYQAIKKPVPRAEYLLVRGGVSIGDNERLDPTFLMEILELREELAEARTAGRLEPNDAAGRSLQAKAALDKVGRLQAVMAGRRDAAVAKLAPLFAHGDLAAVKQQLIVLRYLNRYLDECDAALDAEE
jgi:molecular chaperone HscB